MARQSLKKMARQRTHEAVATEPILRWNHLFVSKGTGHSTLAAEALLSTTPFLKKAKENSHITGSDKNYSHPSQMTNKMKCVLRICDSNHIVQLFFHVKIERRWSPTIIIATDRSYAPVTYHSKKLECDGRSNCLTGFSAQEHSKDQLLNWPISVLKWNTPWLWGVTSIF